MYIEAIDCDRNGGNKIFAYWGDRGTNVTPLPQDENYLDVAGLTAGELQISDLLYLQILLLREVIAKYNHKTTEFMTFLLGVDYAL